TLLGRVITGLSKGASFTRLDWAREQFIARLGIDPHPGTLNLVLESPAEQATWAGVKARPGVPVDPPGAGWCTAHCYPVRIAGRLPGAIVLPHVPDYPGTQIELVAALPLRQTLSLNDGDRLAVDIARPLPVGAAIFDVDGTLVNSIEAFHAVAQLVAAPFGIKVARQIVRQALNNPRPPFWELIVPPDRPDRATFIAKLRREAMRRWPDIIRQRGRLYPGLPGTLAQLQRRGIRLAIVTGSRGGSLDLLREAGLMDAFEPVITGGDVEHRKPHPEGLLKCAAALGIDPGAAVYIGDTPVDIQAGRAAGMAAVAVLSGAGDSALLSAAGPDRIVASHAGLPAILVKDNAPEGSHG
ncbi:MAG: HAD-IA family hydrolase, partial [Anaerolineae bacterium]